MKFSPSLFKYFFFKDRLVLLIFLVIATPFSLFLISSFLFDSNLLVKIEIFPASIFFAAALGLAFLLSQKVNSSLHQLTKKVERIHPTVFGEKQTKNKLALLLEYLDKMDENLKERENEIKKVRDRFVALSAIATAVNQTLDMDRMLNEVLATILEVTGFDGGVVFLLGEENKNFTMRAWKGLQLDHIWAGDQIRLSEGVLGEAVKRQKVVFVPNFEENEGWQIKKFKDKSIKTILVVPMMAKGKVFGAVTLVSFKPRDTSLEENEFLEAIGQQVGMAMDNINLLSGWTKKTHDLSLLLETSSAFSASLNPNQVLEILTQRMMRTLDADFCWTALAGQEKKELIFKSFYSAQKRVSPVEKGERIRMEELPLLRKVVQTSRMVRTGRGDQLTSSEKQLLPLEEASEVILMPLSIETKALGVVGAGLKAPEKLNFENLNLCRSICAQAAIAVENARLYSEEKRKCMQLALINHVSRKVVSTLNLDQLLESVIEAIQLSFKYDHISLFLVDGSCGDLVLKTCFGNLDDAVKPGYRLKKGVGMVGRAAESGKSIPCNDVKSESTYVPAIGPTRSELCVPIKSGKMVVGVLDVENFTKDTFDEQDVAILETLSDLLATAVNNTRLYEEIKRKAHRLELTDQINRAISSTLELKSIFNVVTDELTQVIEYDRISLNFWHSEEHVFEVEMSFCPKRDISFGIHKSIPADETSMYQVVQTGKQYYQAKLVLKPNSKPMDRLLFSEGIRSYVLIPVKDKQEIMAVLGLESRKDHGFDAEATELLESVGSHLSVAIQNARLFSDLQKAYQNLKNTQSNMIEIERFRALGEMANGVVHDFNNILASILGRVQLILKKLKRNQGSSPDEMEKSLQIIESSATDGAKILSRIQEFTKAKPDTAFCPTDPNQVVEDSLELTKAYWKDKALLSNIRIEVKKELKAKGRILGDATELKEVLTNLILNALDAMPEGGRLTLKTEEDEEFIFLTVEDTGVGMTKEIKNKLFVPFFTTKGEEGTGLGLSLANGIITRHQGEIVVESSPGKGSSFTLRLPRCERVEKKTTPAEFKYESALVLVIEDENNIRQVLDEILSTAGHKITLAASGEEGIELFKEQKPDIVITDLGMPGLSGWDVADRVKALNPLTPVILFTGWGVSPKQIKDHKQNVDRIISKPFNMEQILNLISELLAQRKTESVNASL